MQQIADWLQRLGLGQYAQRFPENDITLSILPDLTDQDLKEIGVSLGHRRQLLRDRRSANASRRAGVMSQSNEPTTCGFGTEPPIQLPLSGLQLDHSRPRPMWHSRKQPC
jgi:SAM domain (Sterile alpha motif)